GRIAFSSQPQGWIAGYRMGRDRSAGLGALGDCMLQRTLAKFHLLIVEFTSPTVRRDPPPIFLAMLRPAYLSKKLTPPIPTKDGGRCEQFCKRANIWSR